MRVTLTILLFFVATEAASAREDNMLRRTLKKMDDYQHSSSDDKNSWSNCKGLIPEIDDDKCLKALIPLPSFCCISSVMSNVNSHNMHSGHVQFLIMHLFSTGLWDMERIADSCPISKMNGGYRRMLADGDGIAEPEDYAYLNDMVVGDFSDEFIEYIQGVVDNANITIEDDADEIENEDESIAGIDLVVDTDSDHSDHSDSMDQQKMIVSWLMYSMGMFLQTLEWFGAGIENACTCNYLYDQKCNLEKDCGAEPKKNKNKKKMWTAQPPYHQAHHAVSNWNPSTSHRTCGIDEDFSQQLSACGKRVTRAGRNGKQDTAINLEGIYPCIGYCMQFQPFAKPQDIYQNTSITHGLGDWSVGWIDTLNKARELNTCQAPHFTPALNMTMGPNDIDVMHLSTPERGIVMAVNKGNKKLTFNEATMNMGATVMFVPPPTTLKPRAALRWQIGAPPHLPTALPARRLSPCMTKTRNVFVKARYTGLANSSPYDVKMHMVCRHSNLYPGAATEDWCVSEDLTMDAMHLNEFKYDLDEDITDCMVHFQTEISDTRRLNLGDNKNVPIEIEIGLVGDEDEEEDAKTRKKTSVLNSGA